MNIHYRFFLHIRVSYGKLYELTKDNKLWFVIFLKTQLNKTNFGGFMKKTIYLGLGFLFTGLGAIGVVLPVLPTTPFLLLASFFFAKGSERFHAWFTSTGLYQNHLDSFVQTRSMTLKTKWSILIPASCMLALAYVLCPVTIGKALIVFAFFFKYYYFFFKIKTAEVQS